MECTRCGRSVGEGSYLCSVCEGLRQNTLALSAEAVRDADSYRARQRTSWASGQIGHSAETALPYDARVTPAVERIVSVVKPLTELATRPSAALDLEAALAAVHWFQKIIDSPPEVTYFGNCDADDCIAALYVPVELVSTYVVCPRCGHQYLVADRRAQLAAAARSYLATVKEISRLMGITLGKPVSEQTIRRFVDRGLLSNCGHRASYDALGRLRRSALYRVGDVLALCGADKV